MQTTRQRLVAFIALVAAQVVSVAFAQVPPIASGDLKRAMESIASGDYASAVIIFKPLAESGDSFAQFSMGQLSESGTGVPKNVREAARWYKLAADAGQTDAMTNLGFLHEQGRGVPQDYKEAIRLYATAATAGNAVAQTNLANSYFEGRIVKQDYAEAAKWYRKAAAQNDAQAQYNLARMYDTGHGVERDAKEAFNFYRKAAELGLPAAQLNLGVAYAEGRGVAKDPVAAHQWFNLAAGAADDDNIRENATRNRDVIGTLMTSEQIERAQALAREWKPMVPPPSAGGPLGDAGRVSPPAAATLRQ